MSSAAMWIVDALAEELSRDPALDHQALVRALHRRAGYQQADCLLPGDAVRAALAARLVERLARE